MKNKIISIEDTKFIFKTNFSGDPDRDSFGSDRRNCNIILTSKDQADMLAERGFNVKCTKPKEGEEEGFNPIYFVNASINYESQYPPKIYLVTGGNIPVLLNEDTVSRIDRIYVTNVNVTLNPYFNAKNGRWSLYVDTMYVEQDADNDPFASRYNWSGNGGAGVDFDDEEVEE